MKKYLYTALLVLFSFSQLFSQPEGVSFELNYTGKTSGDVLKLTFTNSGDKLYYQNISPFLLNPGKASQALLIPFGQIINVKAHESKTIYLKGYSVFPDRSNNDNTEANINTDYVLKAISEKQKSYERFFKDTTTYTIRKVNLSELIPFDYILTTPGTFKMLAYTFDVEKNDDLATVLLVEQAQRIAKAYDRLYTAGRIVTHFNADPVFEKELIMQLSIWICASGIEGKALKNTHIKKLIAELYKEFSQQEKGKEINEHIKTYYKILERIGKESNVFLVPMDFDKRPQCLPAIVGLVPTSDNVKAPTLTRNRFDEIAIRNQVMHKRNNSLPCILSEELHGSLKNYMYAFEVEQLISEFNALYVELNDKYDGSSDAKTQLNNANAKLENLKNYSAVSWLKNNAIPKEERAEIALNEYEQITMDMIKTAMGANLIYAVGFFRIISLKHAYLLEYTLDNYKFRDTKYSLDCCDLTRKPSISEIELSNELAAMTLIGINRASNTFYNISEEIKQSDILYEDMVTKFIEAGSELFSLQALQQTFRILTYDKQIICLPDPPPASRIEALEIVNKLLGSNVKQTGELLFDKLNLVYNNQESLEFHFGDCKCGQLKESHMPILPVKDNSINSLTNLESIPLKLTPGFEFSAFYGRSYLSSIGSNNFNGGGLAVYDSISSDLDSILKDNYSKFYKLNEPHSFKFNYFNQISFYAAYDLSENFQYRIGASFLTGSAEGTIPLTYYEKPSDTTTLVTVNGLIYSKIKTWSIESGFRYYYGKQYKVYTGLSAQYMQFNNTQTKTYFDYTEVLSPIVSKRSAFSALWELGVRYYPNQDFFVELGGLLSYRWDSDVTDIKVNGIDKSFRLGVGARF